MSIAGRKMDGFMPSTRVLVLCEMKTAAFRIWTWVAKSTSFDDNHYTISAPSLNNCVKLWTYWSMHVWRQNKQFRLISIIIKPVWYPYRRKLHTFSLIRTILISKKRLVSWILWHINPCRLSINPVYTYRYICIQIVCR